ncbi:MAG TPA: VOC family protein [Solirubrobacteraceae bacterium]|nr:VOC family protein [Solirubrobacteraceae bacterium]
MGERARYTPGTFSWVELATTDQEAAKRFYGDLLGWEMTDSPVSEGVVYTMGAIAGRYVGAISPQPSRQREAGAPPMWNSYVTVESADEALEQARQLGGTVHAPAFDVFSAGRMGVIQDPQGAYLMVWEPREHIGAGLVNTHGALCWNELATPDMEASANFHSRLFGWTTEPLEGSGPAYLVIKNHNGRDNGGIRQAASTEPCYWLVYFGVDDLEAAVERVQELGGTAITDVIAMGSGRFAAMQDPQGAVFALYAGRFDD